MGSERLFSSAADVQAWVGIGIGVLALAFLLLFLLRMRRTNRTVTERSQLWQGRDYACPACGQPMTQGWVLMGKGAIWSERGRGRPGTFALVTNALPNTFSLRVRPASNMAWRCTDCRMLLIDHDKLVG